MREFKFRGKTINEPIEWIYGGSMASKDMGEAIVFEEMICPMEGEEDTGGVELSFHAVYVGIDTVGQFVGRKDKNGVDIYEGDNVRIHNPECEDEDFTTQVLEKGIIHGDFGDFNIWLIDWAMEAGYVFEVIGNIHDKTEDDGS